MDDEPEKFRGEFSFSFKPWYHHVAEILKRQRIICTSALTVFGVLWTFGEASIQFLDANPRGLRYYAFLLFASFVAGIAIGVYQYARSVPDGFENVSCHAQRIAHWQRPHWEFQLAKALLAERLGPYDRELRDLVAGRVFVNAHHPQRVEDYFNWASSRTDNLVRMLGVAKLLILNDFPASLQSTPDKHANPMKILDEAG